MRISCSVMVKKKSRKPKMKCPDVSETANGRAFLKGHFAVLDFRYATAPFSIVLHPCIYCVDRSRQLHGTTSTLVIFISQQGYCKISSDAYTDYTPTCLQLSKQKRQLGASADQSRHDDLIPTPKIHRFQSLQLL